MLGYGATARAILAELHDNDAYAFVWGRDAERVREASARVRSRRRGRPKIRPKSSSARCRRTRSCRSDLIAALQVSRLVIDANYGTRATLARTARREVVAGDAMLEAQARASFDFWLAHLDHVAGG